MSHFTIYNYHSSHKWRAHNSIIQHTDKWKSVLLFEYLKIAIYDPKREKIIEKKSQSEKNRSSYKIRTDGSRNRGNNNSSRLFTFFFSKQNIIFFSRLRSGYFVFFILATTPQTRITISELTKSDKFEQLFRIYSQNKCMQVNLNIIPNYLNVTRRQEQKTTICMKSTTEKDESVSMRNTTAIIYAQCITNPIDLVYKFTKN